ncbi:MAG: ABC transporter permease [Candidatus Abyssobacteria bacterium SURF_5]|uniref:ABC transporter permease n=1 Tax=Abyssobacteria bacterium (strain SURF_5) TaxID=2093360 RepID=A0A3A4NN48_ABYX5|nr:MAG: ABC transporter permease [Candidatus Abyssubacteria bacterium SURF_5]
MKSVFQLYLANARMFLRVRQEIFWVIVLPVFLLILLGFVLKDVAGIGSMRPEDIHFPIGITDNDHSAASRKFIEKLASSSEFDVTELAEEDAREQARTARQRLVIIFPAGFEKDLLTSSAHVEVVADARALALTEMAFNILRERNEEVLSGGEYKRPPLSYRRTEIKTVEEFFGFIDFLVPGIIAMAVLPSCIFSLAPTIVRLREQGILRRLWITPLSKISFVASHVFFRLTLALIQTALICLIGFTLFEPNLGFPVGSLLLFVVLGNLIGSAISFAIAGMAKTPEVASTIANVIALPMLMVCGVFLPLEIMPRKVLPFIWLLPLTHLSEGLRHVMNMQAKLIDLWPTWLVLLGYLLCLFVLSLLTFKWDRMSGAGGR